MIRPDRPPDPSHLRAPGASMADMVGRARRLVAAGGRRLLGITGSPGAGKSTVAQMVRGELGDEALYVPMDGFHLAQCVIDALGLTARKGSPETFDAAGFQCLLRRLRSPEEGPVYAPEFRRELEEPVAGAIAVPASVPLVIVEGNYLLLDRGPWQGTAELFDETWYLDVGPEVRRSRLIARHRSFGRTEDQARNWVLGNDEPNAGLVETTRRRADWIVTAI